MPRHYLNKIVLICLFFGIVSPCLAADLDAPEGIISEIVVSGNRLVPDEKILDQVVSRVGAPLNKELVIGDLKRIFSLGYFEPKSVVANPYQREDGTLIIEFVVKENEPINDVIIYGNNSVEDLDVYALFDDLIAMPESAKAISEKILTLERAYLEKGFIIAKVSDIDLDESGTLKIYIDEGIIDKIVYKGNDKTKSSFLNRLVKDTKVNEPYNELKFSKDFQRLQRTKYFSNVSRTVKPSDESDGYTLELQLAESSTTTVGLGGGINSNAGLFGNTNFSKGNLRGRGESININAILGSGFGAGATINNNSNLVRRGRFTQLSANYTVPFYRGSNFTLNRSLNFTRGPNFNVDLSRQTLLGLETRASKAVGNNHRFSLGAAANYISLDDRDRRQYVTEVARNIIEVDGMTRRDVLDAQGNNFLSGKMGIARAEARKLRDEQIVDGFFVGVSPSYRYTNIKDPSRPRDGWKTRVNLTPTWGFNSVSSSTKLDFSTTKYFPIGKESLFLFNTRGGYQVFGDLPQFAKYRLGTNNGVRGYRQFSELGVGNKLLISTAEFRTPIYNVVPAFKNVRWIKNLDFAVFADAGLVGGDVRLNRITDRLSQAASFGFGVRVKIPFIGGLRFDVGFPLIDALINDRLFRFNFGPADFF